MQKKQNEDMRSNYWVVFLGVCIWSESWASSGPDKTTAPEDTDYSATPWTEYGDFGESAEEAKDAKFFQKGRFYGIAAGVGFDQISGNRGALWKGGFPLVEFKILYWFDFHFALELHYTTAPHSFDQLASNGTTVDEHYDVRLNRFGAGFRYYFDTENASAAIHFSNPHLMLGLSDYAKTETPTILGGSADKQESIGFALGGGVEFPIQPKSSYIQLEGMAHFIKFKDTDLAKYYGLSDLKGTFFTGTLSLLFTW